MFLTKSENISHPKKSIIVLKSPSYSVDFSGFSKFEEVKKRFSLYYPVFRSNHPKIDKENILLKDDDEFYDIKINKNDMGIDTVYHAADNLIVKIKNFSGKFFVCSLNVHHKNGVSNIFEINDTIFYLKGNNVEKIELISIEDQNPYNNVWIMNYKPKIMILDSSFSKNLQYASLKLQSLFNDKQFFSAILRNNRIVSIYDDYDGIIYLNEIKNRIETKKPHITINIEDDFIAKTEVWFENEFKHAGYIKNPFNKNKIFSLNFFQKIILFIKTYFVIIILFLFLGGLMVLLF